MRVAVVMVLRVSGQISGAGMDSEGGRGSTMVASSGGSCLMLGGVWLPLPLTGVTPVSISSICRPDKEES